MAERFLDAGDVRLCYEVFGTDLPVAAPTVVLVMGLGLDMVWWREDFCNQLVERGLRVVRFDNRDVGRSTRLSGPGVGPMGFLRRKATPSYRLEDMADDLAALIRHVVPTGAHVVGVSMGSFIAQEAAIRHPALVRSLVSIMGRPGDGRTGKVAKRMLVEFLRPVPASAREADEALVRSFARIGSSGRTAADDADVRELSLRSRQRSTDEAGSGRQLAAILAESDRTPGLRTLRVPTLVIHGDRDRIVLPSGGRATAAAVTGAELMILAGMGHDLPRRIWPDVIDAIARTAARAD